jgi:hypothetical protein
MPEDHGPHFASRHLGGVNVGPRTLPASTEQCATPSKGKKVMSGIDSKSAVIPSGAWVAA